MTSIPVNNAKSLAMDFANKAPEKISGTGETGSFTDVLNKQTEGGKTETKTENVHTEASKPYTRVNNSNRGKVKQDEVTDTGNKEIEETDKVMDAITEAGDKIVKEIADELGISEEDVLQIMEILGLTCVDLMQPENLMAIVMEASGETDPMALLTNEELGVSLKNLNQFVQNLKSDIEAAYSISEEQINDLLNQMQEKDEGVVTTPIDEEVNVQEKQPMITVENQTDGEEAVKTEDTKTASDTTIDLNGSEIQKEVKDVPVSENGGKETGHEAKGQDNATNQNVFAQNLNQGTTVQNSAVTENVAFTAPQTKEIMNQIMDYMRIQIKPEMTQLEMQLHPESLGNVNVHIASKEGVVTAQFTTQNETVRAALESQIVQLKETFAQQGVKVEAIEVSVQANGFRQEYEDSRNHENAGEDDKKKSVARRINLGNPEMFNEESLSEEEQLAVSMMEANGNTVDYTA